MTTLRAFLIATLILSNCSGEPADGASFALALEQVANAVAPVAIAHAGDSRLFITEQAGRIVIFEGTRVLPTPFLDIRPLVRSGDEQGMLGLAFHPRYLQNGFFYVNYTNTAGDTVIARYSVSTTNPNIANPASAVVLLRIDQPFPNHNGGQLKFGPDGYLYIGMGDGGSGGDPLNHAQNLQSLLGKMLRIDVDRTLPGLQYAIPDDNPFRNHPTARREIWSLGLRNPWRFTFDRLTGDMFIADVGQNAWEEVSFQPGTSGGGENYGWRIMEGAHCYPPGASCSASGLVLPILEYGRQQGDCSVTGGYRYRGMDYPRMHGFYFYGDYCTGRIWAATQQGDGSWTTEPVLNAGVNITTFGEDFVGELYVAGHGGAIYRITDIAPTPPRRRPAGRR
jgi:hypothetical protein